jgi:hypothetical protein
VACLLSEIALQLQLQFSILFTDTFRLFLLVFNRKGAVIINNVLGVLAAILFVSSRYASSVEMLLLARLVVGLSSGE